MQLLVVVVVEPAQFQESADVPHMVRPRTMMDMLLLGAFVWAVVPAGMLS